MVLLVTAANQIIGIGKALMNSEEIGLKEKGFVVKPIKIIMERDLFPKWK